MQRLIRVRKNDRGTLRPLSYTVWEGVKGRLNISYYKPDAQFPPTTINIVIINNIEIVIENAFFIFSVFSTRNSIIAPIKNGPTVPTNTPNAYIKKPPLEVLAGGIVVNACIPRLFPKNCTLREGEAKEKFVVQRGLTGSIFLPKREKN